MNTKRDTNRSKTTVVVNKTTEGTLADQALDHVVGGLNPQPLPPGYRAEAANPVGRFVIA